MFTQFKKKYSKICFKNCVSKKCIKKYFVKICFKNSFVNFIFILFQCQFFLKTKIKKIKNYNF